MKTIHEYKELVATFTHLPIAIYKAGNIGDAIQTVAARELWHVYDFCERNRPWTWTDEMVVPMVGWYGEFFETSPARVILIGLHLSYQARIKILGSRYLQDWLRAMQIQQEFPALARDTSTRDFLRSIHVDSEFAGCVTETLSRYEGPREGVLNIDTSRHDSGRALYQSYSSNEIPVISDLILTGEMRLAEIRCAKLVRTNRLHIYLPCKAMGTNVELLDIMNTFEPHRFSGFAYAAEPRVYSLL